MFMHGKELSGMSITHRMIFISLVPNGSNGLFETVFLLKAIG